MYIAVQVMRGVQKINSKTVTSSMLGVFRSVLTVLYCTVLYCTVLYCTVLYRVQGRPQDQDGVPLPGEAVSTAAALQLTL